MNVLDLLELVESIDLVTPSNSNFQNGEDVLCE